MELLFRSLGPRHDEVSFVLAGEQILATWEEGDGGDSTTREVQVEIRRRAVFEIVGNACEDAPELESDWFAVSYAD